MLGQDLDGNVAGQFSAVGLVYLAHSTCTNRGDFHDRDKKAGYVTRLRSQFYFMYLIYLAKENRIGKSTDNWKSGAPLESPIPRSKSTVRPAAYTYVVPT